MGATDGRGTVMKRLLAALLSLCLVGSLLFDATAFAIDLQGDAGLPPGLASGPPAEQTDPGVAIVLTGAGPRVFGWSTVPVNVHLLPLRDGVVWYRWGPGPGAWTKAIGPVAAPEGKQTLSAVLIDPDGLVGPTVTRVVRSDFDARPSLLTAAVENPEATSAPLSAAGSVTVRVTVRSGAGTSVRRVGGRDRYEVAAAVSRGFPAAQTVLLASGEKFPDALTASGLAGCLQSPLLLTKRLSIPSAIASEIRRLGATKAIVAGGPMSVDPAVVRQLQGMGLTVERIDGPDRYAVAANTADRIAAITGVRGRALIARGDIYPDALSLGPLAYVRREPILLVQPKILPSATRAALNSGYSSAAIAGGPVSVSPGVEDQIEAIVGSTVRWGGIDRYHAAVNIASAGAASGSNSWNYVAIAKGTDYADALTGGAGAGRRAGLLLLTAPTPLTPVTERTLTAQAGEIDAVDVLGGPVSITDVTYEQIRTIFQ